MPMLWVETGRWLGFAHCQPNLKGMQGGDGEHLRSSSEPCACIIL